jgi:hypothetical protein
MQIIVDVKQMAGAIEKMPQYQELRAKCVCVCVCHTHLFKHTCTHRSYHHAVPKRFLGDQRERERERERKRERERPGTERERERERVY